MRAREFTGDADNNTSTLPDPQVKEGAEMIAYHKHPTQPNLWTFPDAYKDDEEVESPYMSWEPENTDPNPKPAS